MSRPFIASDAGSAALPLDAWVLGWLFFPLLIKGLHKGITRCIFRTNALKHASDEKKGKAALHLTKVVLYAISVGLMWPATGSLLGGQLNSMPPAPLHQPFSIFSDNVRYLKWAMTIPVALYLYELVSDPSPSAVTWLHHGASIVGVAFFSGAVPWLNANDALLFSQVAIIVWSFLSFNFVSYLSFAIYQLLGRRYDRQKAYVIRFVSAFVVVVVGLEHTLVYVFLGLKLRHFHSSAPIVALFVLDSAIFFEHLWTLYCLFWMHKSCMRRLRASKYPDAGGAAAQEEGVPVATRQTSAEELDHAVSRQIRNATRRATNRDLLSAGRRPADDPGAEQPAGPPTVADGSSSKRGLTRGVSRKLAAFHQYMNELGREEASTAGMTTRETQVLCQVLGEDRPLADSTLAALGLVRAPGWQRAARCIEAARVLGKSSSSASSAAATSSTSSSAATVNARNSRPARLSFTDLDRVSEKSEDGA